MNIYDIIVFFGALLHGFAKAATDLRMFYPEKNAFHRWAFNHSSLMAALNYFYGSGKKWNNGYFWSADFWHYWEHMKGLSLVLIAVAARQASLHPLWFLSLYWIEGRAFVFVFHYWLGDVKRGSFWHFIKSSFSL